MNLFMLTYVQTDFCKAAPKMFLRVISGWWNTRGNCLQFLAYLLLYFIFSSTPFVFKQNHDSVKNKLSSRTDHPVQCGVLRLPHSWSRRLISRSHSGIFQNTSLWPSNSRGPPLFRKLSRTESEGNATLQPGKNCSQELTGIFKPL